MISFERTNESEMVKGDLPGFLDNETLRKWKIIGEKETLKNAFTRVAKSIASLESSYEDGDVAGFEAAIMSQLLLKKIIPSTPILMNAGRFENVPLSACIVPPIELKDDWLKIKTIVDELHLQGMGTGFNFDETDEPIRMIKFLNQVGIDGQKDERQLRPVGNIGTMSLDNPRIIEFINLKSNAEIGHEDWVFNLSVSLTDDQIGKILNKEDIDFLDGRKISANEILENLARAIWLSGDPGLVFMDRVRADNVVPSAGESVSVAPCGEIGLARGESCQFLYINLGKFVNKDKVNYEELEDAVKLSIHFLDNVVDYNIKNTSNLKSASMMRNKRKIGLGVCGLDDLLRSLSLRYGSEESIKLAGELLSFINYHSKRASVELAKQRGSFEMFDESQFASGDSYVMNRLASEQTETVSKNEWLDLIKEIKERGIRHCATISLPPTGRSSQIIRASQSIEPNFKDFLEVASYEQISMMATIQKFVDESISKTINVKNETTIDEIKQILLDSMEHKLKGITIYRDGSRSNQPEKM
jgi:ribonucleoside-diphosphate reductase alpha chain